MRRRSDDHATSMLFASMMWIRNLSVGILLLTILLLATWPYQDSIKQSFAPRPAPVKASPEPPIDIVVDGIHVSTGLKYDSNFSIVKNACTSCHSGKLIAQNRATRAGWAEMISWMQKTQGLPDLGDQHAIILDYLAKHYAPEQQGRRKNIDPTEIEWYVLEL